MPAGESSGFRLLFIGLSCINVFAQAKYLCKCWLFKKKVRGVRKTRCGCKGFALVVFMITKNLKKANFGCKTCCFVVY